MKAFAKTLFRTRIQDDPDKKRTQIDACSDMVLAWERLTPDLIESSFEHLKNLEFWHVDVNGNKIILEHHHREYCSLSRKQKHEYDQVHGYKE